MSKITIEEPASGTTVVVGTNFRVAGSTEPITITTPSGGDHEISPSSVHFSVDGGAGQPATPLGADWSTWEASVRVTTAGAHTIKVTAKYTAPGQPIEKNDVTVQAVFTPLNLLQPAGPVGTVDVDVEVAAQHPAGISGVSARFDGQGAVALNGSSGTWKGHFQLSSPIIPPGGRDARLDLEAKSGDGTSHTATKQVRLVDVSVPVITAFTPTDGEKLPGTAVGARVTVVATVRDSGEGQLRSGLSRVEVSVDGTTTNAKPLTVGDPSTWTANVFVPGADDHVLTVQAVGESAAHTSVPVRHRVVVVARADLRDLSQQTYLADLVAFTTRRLLTRAADGAALPPFVTPGHLAEAVGQDLPTVARMSPAQASAPIRSQRLVVEALGRYMRPGAPAPVAAWPLRDGQGSVAADTASGLCDGDLEGAAWVPGADPPVLGFNPAVPSYVRVTPQESAQVRVRSQLTLVARIRPSGATPDAAVIIHKEGEYEVARFPDGTVRWALATATPGWNWVNTGAVAPDGVWTHVAVAYDGAVVRTWLDGVLRHRGAASGPIGDVVVGSDELWIGGRPAEALFFAGALADVAVFDRALTEYDLYRLLGRSGDADGTRLWVDDDLPPGAVPTAEADTWDWVPSDPAPSTGARCHRSAIAAGVHQHYFSIPATGFPVDRGNDLVTEVWVDPANPPREIMVQWLDADGSWEHRAYWGENLIEWGKDATASRRRIGDLPPAGSWVTLRVPARLVGLEHAVVHGVAYTLYDGRVAWDRTGRITGPAAAAASGHLAAAYAELVRAHGTSGVELRLARGAPTDQRAALAARLGISLGPARPDELDTLLLDSSELDAAALADIFGYDDPLGAAPPAAAPALLTRWRLAALRARWREADGGTQSAAQPPVVDPEVLVPGDVIDAASQAGVLLADRRAWRATQLAALRAVRAGAADDKAAVAAAVGQVLSGVELDAIAADRRAGKDISASLATAALSLRGLLRVLRLRDLAATGPLRDDEWEALVVELVHVLRLRNWASWRQLERTRDVVVDPAVFRDATATDSTPLPAFIDGPARQTWLDRLAARTGAVAAVASAQAAALAAADQAALPLLRDALVATLDPGLPPGDAADALTSALFVDVGAGTQDVTTRVGQAVESVQALVLAARANRLVPQASWPPAAASASWRLKESADYPRADFDEEWQWMGAYAAWQAAVSIFFRPELLLYPTLRPGATPAFAALLKGLAEAGSDLTPQGARDQAAVFREKLDATQRAALSPAGGPILPLVLTDQLTPAGVAQLAAGQPKVLANFAALRDVPGWLLEVLWLVPLQLAVSLSRAGQQLAAIDWLRTLYAYDEASGQRIVFDGFRKDAAGAPVLARPQDWLLGEELNPHRIADGRAGAQLRFTLLLLARCLVEHADAEFTADTPESRPRARDLYLAAARSLRVPEFNDPPGQPAPANPLLAVLRGRVAVNLGKLRRGLTIAGVPRPAPGPDAVGVPSLVLPTGDGIPTPPQRPPLPTPYRYATLVARAQQLLTSSSQVESSYLAALAGADAEAYTEARANDDLELAGARLQVQRSAAQIAESEVVTARLQLARAEDHASTLAGWIAGGENQWERALLASYQQIAEIRTMVAFADAAVTMFSAAASATLSGAPAAGFVSVAADARYLASSALAMAEASSQTAGQRASWERRQQEWALQETLARDDAAVASQQIAVTRARAGLAADEQAVAEAAQRHAQSAVTYLAGRRLTGEMYAWMAGELGEVYRYLLRQATSVAQLAEQQLAFERQAPPPATIQANYWTVGTGTDGAKAPDRRGLTGSARLLRDLTELDQYAFRTNRRKLNLEQVFSLSLTAPEAFAQFRHTGVLPFATPMEAFDRRFPGQFLRTIRRVRLSLVALVPATQGIAATLTCSGQSRVVVGQLGTFAPITLTRPPEPVHYTASANATGIFELDPQPELKYWFEDHGVDTTWELRLPRPANPIDYRAIADVLVTIEYTALYDADYARQVRAAQPRRARGTLARSLRQDYPDAWYALVEPDPAAPAVVPPVSLPIGRADFPRNVEDVKLDAVSLLVVRSEPRPDEAAELGVDHLHLVRGDRRIEGGAATAVDDVISSRLGSGSTWSGLLDPPELVAPSGGGVATAWDKSPTGDWELALAQDPGTREALRSAQIDDLALVLSYRAELPPWPASD